MRAVYGQPLGIAFNFMSEYHGPWPPAQLAKAFRAYQGMVILHDALPSGNAGRAGHALWIGRDRFGIEANDVQFLGYWDAGSGLTSEANDVKLACWVRPGKVLLPNFRSLGHLDCFFRSAWCRNGH
jgi:hypothetical protein